MIQRAKQRRRMESGVVLNYQSEEMETVDDDAELPDDDVEEVDSDGVDKKGSSIGQEVSIYNS